MGPKSTISPWNSASSLVQISRIASTRSRSSRQRSFGSVPWFSISSRFQPPPTPKSTRPPETKSRLATAFAVVIGSRSTTSTIPKPSKRRLEFSAAMVSATKGSRVRL